MLYSNPFYSHLTYEKSLNIYSCGGPLGPASLPPAPLPGPLRDIHHCLLKVLGACGVPGHQRSRQEFAGVALLLFSIEKNMGPGRHPTGWQPMIFDELSETQQLWLEGGQKSISALVQL